MELLANMIDVNGSNPNYITQIDNVLVQKRKKGNEVKMNENSFLWLLIGRTKLKMMKYDMIFEFNSSIVN